MKKQELEEEELEGPKEEPSSEDPTGLAITPRSNKLGLLVAKRDWKYGPDRPSPHPKSNQPYWVNLSKALRVTPEKARRMLCSNCEYLDNVPETIQSLEVIPYNVEDATGGGRGYCSMFKFICHNLKSCQEWEERPSTEEE